MTRRRFMKSTLATTSLAVAASKTRSARAADTKARPAPAYFELRTYRLRIGDQPKLAQDFMGEVLVPTLNRLGVSPVGVFTGLFAPDLPSLTVLTQYPSLASFDSTRKRLATEMGKSKSAVAKAFLTPPGVSPAYVRCDTQLLLAFANLPALVPPPEAKEKKPRIFELRTYETPTDHALARKAEMFGDEMGELAIFKRCGLRPVFFATTVVGPRQPSLIYMLAFPDLAARMAAWDRFRADPAWAKLKVTPGYTDADIMANISDAILSPAAASQI